MRKIRRSITIDPLIWSKLGKAAKQLKSLELLEQDEGVSSILEKLAIDFLNSVSPKIKKIPLKEEEKEND